MVLLGHLEQRGSAFNTLNIVLPGGVSTVNNNNRTVSPTINIGNNQGNIVLGDHSTNTVTNSGGEMERFAELTERLLSEIAKQTPGSGLSDLKDVVEAVRSNAQSDKPSRPVIGGLLDTAQKIVTTIAATGVLVPVFTSWIEFAKGLFS